VKGSPRLHGYVLAVGLIAVLTSVKVLAGEGLGREVPFFLYPVALIAVGWFGQPRSALFATVLAVLAGWLFFIRSSGAAGLHALIPLAALALEGAAITALVVRLRAAYRLAEQAAERVARLQHLTAALAAARTPDEIAQIIVEQGVAALGATIGVVRRAISENELEAVAHLGLSPEDVVRYRIMNASDGLPSSVAFRTGEPQWIEGDRDFSSKYPDVPKDKFPVQAAVAALPLGVEGRRIGVMTFRFEEPRRFSMQERTLLETFASQAAQALERADLYIQEVALRQRLESLEALTEAFSEAMTREEVADVVVDLGMLAADADTCTVYTLDASGRSLHLIGHRGVAAPIVERISVLTAESGNPAFAILESGEPMFAETEREYRAYYPEIANLKVEGERARAFWCVPLTAEGKSFGMMAMGYYEPRRFGPVERTFVATFTRHCAEALRRAERLDAEQRARNAADVANRAKDEFLATVSHELRTPLNAILGWAKMMSAAELDEAKRQRAVATIERNAVAMAQLIEDLLDVSRIISGKMRLEVQSVDLSRIVEAALESVRPAADAKSIKLSATLYAVREPLLADPPRLQQIIWNLLSNAVKFTPDGGQVEISVRGGTASTEIRVTDSGRGIAPEFLPLVFEPFRQEHPTHSRARGGLGLGLAITQQLVELHGGHVEAHSDGPGRGATFVVHLPLSRVAAEPRPEASAGRRVRPEGDFERPSALLALSVLVVDDDEDARQLVQAVLEECGAKVTAVDSVDSALEVLSRGVTDVLVSDIGMPGQDGYDLIRRVRALPGDAANLPAAALTAYARAEDRHRALNAGYSRHLAKPVEPSELVAVVAALAHARATRSEAI
jgi:signal transduction histidine kinase/ActR/RegA family two-component response regulator